MSPNEEKPKIVVDDDWKAQARAEKEKLSSEQKKAPETPGRPAGEGMQIPPASFATLVSAIASQAMFALGAIPDPQTKRRYLNLDLAKHQIDTLKVLEEKTAGHLTEEEKKLLDTTLYELRSNYIQIAQHMAKV